MVQMNMINRIRAAAGLLMGKSLTQHQLAHFFGRGGGVDRPAKSYGAVVAVFSCVRARAQAIAGMPLVISTLDDQVLESGPIVELTECPNPAMTRRAFWERTSSILDLFGSVFWVMVLDGIGRPVEVVPVCPLQMEAIKNKRTGEVRGWKYRAAGSMACEEIFLPVEQVHQIIDPDFEDPHSPLEGMSPRRSVALAISQYFKSDLANEASLDNGFEPGGAFLVDQKLTDEQARDLRSEVHERHMGVRNRRRHLLLTGGVKWQTIGTSFRDAEMVELKRLARTDICSAFNVPPAIAGYYEDSNYAHADASDRMFWANTILPRAARLAEEWDLAVVSKWEGDQSLRSADATRRGITHPQRCCPTFRDGQRATGRRGGVLFPWFDASGIPAVQRASLEVTEQAYKLWTMGTPINAIYRAYDMPFPELPYGDRGMKPIGLEPYGVNASDLIDDPDGSDPETDLMSDGKQTAPRPRKTPRNRLSGPSGGSGGSEAVRATEATRAKLWELWRLSWQPLEKSAASRIRSHFYDLRSETLANLQRLADQIAPVPGKAASAGVKFHPDRKRDVIGEVLFDLVAAGDSLVVKVQPLLREAHRLGGEQTMREAADAKGSEAPDPFNIHDPELPRLLAGRDIRLKDVDANLRERLARKLADAIDQGRTVTEIVEEVRGEFGFAHKRAATIARTEIGGAVEESRQLARVQAGVPMKSWLSSRKEAARPQHEATERQTTASPIPIGERFTIAGTDVTCQHPREAGLPPEQSINCGCTTLSRYEGDSIKAVMARYLQRGFLGYAELLGRDQPNPQTKDGKPCPKGTPSPN